MFKIHFSKPQIPLILLLSVSLISGPLQIQAQIRNTESQQTHFEKMADYLTMGTGKWTGDNKNHNPDNPRSPRAFGLWFERPMQNLLTIKVVAYQNDTTVLSSQGIFSWHPGKKQFIHVTADRGDGYSEGVSEFPTDSTFISTLVVYRPNGKTFDHKDENFIVNENMHRNTSYRKDEKGIWVESGRWTWTRDRQR